MSVLNFCRWVSLKWRHHFILLEQIQRHATTSAAVALLVALVGIIMQRWKKDCLDWVGWVRYLWHDLGLWVINFLRLNPTLKQTRFSYRRVQMLWRWQTNIPVGENFFIKSKCKENTFYSLKSTMMKLKMIVFLTCHDFSQFFVISCPWLIESFAG